MRKNKTIDAIFSKELDDDLRNYYLTDNKRLKEKLRVKIIERVIPYVKRISSGLARRSSDPLEDIMQVGSIGLMKAIEKYNPFTGTSFKTYATYLITGEIRHYLRDKASVIKAPRQMYELYYRVNQIVQKLTEQLGRPPTDCEIAEELQCPVDKVTQAQEVERRRQLISLDQFITGESGSETMYVERLVDEKYLELVDNQETRITLDKVLGKLKNDLRIVVYMTYYEDMSQSQIAQALGISQMQVSRRLKKALEQLAKLMQNPTTNQKQPLSNMTSSRQQAQS